MRLKSMLQWSGLVLLWSLMFVSCVSHSKQVQETNATTQIPHTAPPENPPLVIRPPVFSDAASYTIMGEHHIERWHFIAYMTSVHKELDPEYLGRLYDAYLIATKAEGVKLVLALAQMIHETGFLRFGGSVSREQHNFAGLGALDASTAGASFPDIETGVLAQVQHLKAYGSTEPLATILVNPRFRFVSRGIAPTIDRLTGRWAMDPNYHLRLLSHINRLVSWEPAAQLPASPR